MTAKLVELVIKNGTWQGSKLLAKLEEWQTVEDVKANVQKGDILVYFVGGVTFSEVSALRILARLTGRSITIGTTSMLRSDVLVDSICERSQ